MSGVGVDGGYQPPIPVPGVNSQVTYQPVSYPPGPSAWGAGWTWPIQASGQVYASDLNQQLSQPVAFLSRKPMFQGAQQTAQSIADSTSTPVNLDTEISDPWQMHNFGSPANVTVPYACDGVWLVQGSIPYAVSTNGAYFAAQLSYNVNDIITGEIMQGPNSRVVPAVADLIAANAGDTFQLVAKQTTTAALDTWVSTPSTPKVAYADYGTPVLTCRWVAANNSLHGGVFNGVQLGLPDPSTWNPGDEVTSARFNSDIRNNVLFLSNVPYSRGMVTGTPAAIPAGTPSLVSGMTANLDNWGTWNASSSTWTCPVSGLYLVYGQVEFPTQSNPFTASVHLNCTLSGNAVTYSGADVYGATVGAVVFKTVRFTAGDSFQLYGYQDFGSPLTPNNETNTRFFSLWLSA